MKFISAIAILATLLCYSSFIGCSGGAEKTAGGVADNARGILHSIWQNPEEEEKKKE